MTRKYARLALPRDVVKRIFLDAENWPLWFPGVRWVEILDRTDERILAAVRGRYMGRHIYGDLDCRIEADGLFQHQLTGWVKQWDTHWRFLEPPDGRGTTLSCEVALDFGFIGAFLPTTLVDRFTDSVFGDTVSQIEEYVQTLPVEERSAGADEGEPPLLQVYETPVGVEVRVAGRRFTVDRKGIVTKWKD